MKNLPNELTILDEVLFIKNRSLLERVRIEDIISIKSEGNYCDILTQQQKKYVVKRSLTQMLELLERHGFLRCHQRYLLQARLITKIDVSGNLIYLEALTFPIGRKYKDELLSRLTII